MGMEERPAVAPMEDEEGRLLQKLTSESRALEEEGRDGGGGAFAAKESLGRRLPPLGPLIFRSSVPPRSVPLLPFVMLC